MYKLVGHSLSPGEWFLPESQGVTVQERESASTIQLGPDGPGVGFDDWLLDTWPGGERYVWRVKDLGDTVNTETRTIELEHVIKVLDDTTIPDEITAGTAQEAAAAVLALQGDWALGDFAYQVSNDYSFSGQSVLDALGAITDTLADAVWEYDLTVYPFVLHIRQRDNTAACEMRGGRNLSTLKKSVSRTGMYTRIYPIGANELRITGGYLSKNENLYGVIGHTETDQTKESEGALTAWAQGRLNRHCEPRVNITISGLELSGETGEELDRLKINRVCRVPLPEFSTVIEERIVKLQWKDRLKEPENVTVTLCNNSADVSEIIRNQSRETAKAARGSAKQNKIIDECNRRIFFETFDECGHFHVLLSVTSESLRVHFDNALESTRSEFALTSESMRVYFENEIACTRSEMQMTSESLRVQFENEIASTRSEMQITSESLRVQFENEIASARSEFNITAESLRVSFENEISSARSEFSATAESMRISFESDIGSVRSEIGVQADCISLVVTSGSNPTIKAAQIVASVNNSGSSVLISADKILLDGNTTVGGMMSVSGGSLVVAGGIKSTGSVSAEHFYLGTGAIPTASLEYGVYNLQIVQSGNTYTLQKQSYSDTTWVDVGNFSRAVTSLGYAWGSGATVGQLTVTAYPQNYSTVLLGLVVDGSWTDQSFTGRVKYYEGQDDEQTYNTNVNFYGAVSSPTWNDNGMKYGDTYSGGIYKPTQRRVTVGVSITGHGTVVGQTFGLKQSGGKVLLWKDSSSGDSMAGVDLDVTLDTGSISGSGASGSRTVKAKAGNDEMDSATLTDYGDGYSAGRTVGRADMGVAYDSAYIVGQTTKKVVKVTVGGAAYVEPTLDVGSVTGSGTSGKRTVTLKIGAVNVTSSEITDYGDGYTAGRNDVTITKGSWSSGTISFTKSAGTASTKEVNLTAASTTWSGNTGSRVIWDGTAADSQHGVSTGYTVTVDATTRYKEGWKGCYDSMSTTATTSGTLNYGATASVVIKQTDKDGNEQTRVTKTYTAPADRWQDGYDNARLTYKYTQAEYDAALATVPSGYFNSATITFDGSRDLGSSDEGNDGAVTAAAKNGNTTLGSGSKTIHMGVGSWSSGKIGVTCRLDNSNGKCINRVYVSKPSVTGVRLVKTGGTYTVYGKVGGSSEIQLASGLSG